MLLAKTRLAIYIRSLGKGTQIANHVGVSIITPNMAVLLEYVTNPSTTISKGKGESNEGIIVSPTTISELAIKR